MAGDLTFPSQQQIKQPNMVNRVSLDKLIHRDINRNAFPIRITFSSRAHEVFYRKNHKPGLELSLNSVKKIPQIPYKIPFL